MQGKTRASAWRRRLYAGLLVLSAGNVFSQVPPAATGAPPAEVFVQTGNSVHNTMVRFSSDGQRVASCDGVGSVVGWDAQSGRQYREIHRHTGMCLGLSFTPDSQYVVSSGGARSGNDVVLSRWVDGVAVQNWEGHKGQVRDVVATLDSKGAWSLGESDGLKLWTAGKDQPLRNLPLLLPGEDPGKAIFNASMVLSRDQKWAYVARTDGTLLAVDLGSSPTLAPVLLGRLGEAVSSLALSPDGSRLAVSSGNMMGATSRDVLVLSTATGQQVRRLVGHTGNVFTLAFSPDGQLLASAAQIDTTAMLNGGMKAVDGHESLRLWRVADGALLAEARNQRNRNGGPFLRGSLDFSGAASGSRPRLALALWDEAVRVFEVNDNKLELQHTLEGRGLSPRQLRVSDAISKMMVSDGRPRIAPKTSYLQAAEVRREFGQDADWTDARQKRVDVIYSPRGMSTNVQRASMWDLKTGKLERVLDWQRGPTSALGVDAKGRFTSVAPLFPHTIMIAPLKTRMVREATADTDGQISLRHFGYEPWDGRPDDIFTPLVDPASMAAVPAAPAATGADTAKTGPGKVPDERAYGTELIIQSPSQQWTVIAGEPIGNAAVIAASGMSPRIFVQQRMADGVQLSRYEIAMPGIVRAMSIAKNERTLWVSGTKAGLPYNMEHRAWLLAIDLSNGTIQRSWDLVTGLTVDLIIAHPGGDMAITNGGTNLSIWDRRQAERKYFVKASDSLRPVKAIALTDDGQTIAAADNAGWMVQWRWPENAEPVPLWTRQLASPSPHLLSFMDKGQRIAAGASDGSVRLLKSTDGSEIARMIRFDNDEWITIIPEGYFVASQEGDRWVNVRMGGKVYGIDQFYDVFYRPDIVERRLAGQPIAPLITVTLTDALRDPPPQVSLQLPEKTPATAGQKIRLNLEALTQGGGVGELRVLHNGKLVEVLNRTVIRTGLASTLAASGASAPINAPVKAAEVASVQPQGALRGEETVTRALRLAVQAQQDTLVIAPPLQQLKSQVEVELVPGENSFSVIGFNTAGNLNARPVTRSMVAQGTAPAPRVFVLAVGVDIFKNPNAAPTLQFAVKDSSDFAAALRQRLDSLGSAYRNAPVVIRMLQNENATRSGLVQALDDLQKEVRSNDLLVWFVASHGTLDNNAQYGIVLQDWDGKASADSLFSTTSILDASRRIKAFNQFVILDTCHAGGVSSLVRGLYDARLAVLARNMGLHVFASASATEEALDGYQGNGLFTHTLLKGLNTSLADKNADKQITVNELGDFARRETMRIARLLRHNQEPLLLNFGKDVTVYAID